MLLTRNFNTKTKIGIFWSIFVCFKVQRPINYGTKRLVVFYILIIFSFFRYSISGFDFARFDLRGDKIELELGTTPHDELQPVDPPESSHAKDEKNRSFDNPVYGTSVEEVS